jgi:hypothetical protein
LSLLRNYMMKINRPHIGVYDPKCRENQTRMYVQ